MGTSSGCKPWLDPPRACDRFARLETDQRVVRAECVRRAGHRLDGDAAPGDVGEGSPCEDNEVGVGLVYPERDARAAVRVVEQDARPTVAVTLELGVRIVEHRAADRPAAAEVVLGAVDGFRAHRKAT